MMSFNFFVKLVMEKSLPSKAYRRGVSKPLRESQILAKKIKKLRSIDGLG
jgi:hypothetical protein